MAIKSMTNYNYCIVTHTLIEFNCKSKWKMSYEVTSFEFRFARW